jgi:HAD superfamily hydrolase (TIGR01549 family)
MGRSCSTTSLWGIEMEIVFDLDGTLVNSSAQVLLTTQAFIAEHTGKRLDLEEIKRREGGSFEATFANFGIHSITEELVSKWGRFALAHEYQAFPGIPELVEVLANQEFRLHVWTARDAASTQHILERTGLMSRFNGTIGCWNPRAPKPDPNGLAEIVNNARPERVVVIGDGWTDRMGAESYGATLIEALWGKPAGAVSLSGVAGKCARHPSDCLGLIDPLRVAPSLT